MLFMIFFVINETNWIACCFMSLTTSTVPNCAAVYGSYSPLEILVQLPVGTWKDCGAAKLT